MKLRRALIYMSMFFASAKFSNGIMNNNTEWHCVFVLLVSELEVFLYIGGKIAVMHTRNSDDFSTLLLGSV